MAEFAIISDNYVKGIALNCRLCAKFGMPCTHQPSNGECTPNITGKIVEMMLFAYTLPVREATGIGPHKSAQTLPKRLSALGPSRILGMVECACLLLKLGG